MDKKEQTSMRLTVEAKHLIKEMADRLGGSQAAVFELAIRRMAKEEGRK